MTNEFCSVIMSATRRRELDRITDKLLKERLIACADTFPMRSRYWWKGRIVSEKRYLTIAYSMLKLKKKIITRVRALHSDECPGIVFTAIDANKDFLQWIEASTNNT